MVLVLAGPPGTGKDTIANYLVRQFNFIHIRFKDALIPLVLGAYKVDMAWFDQHYTRELKDQPCPELLNMSPRQALIHMSEHVIKPTFTESAFGTIIARRIVPGQYTVISDGGGWAPELKPVVDAVGAHNVFILQLTRDHCSYTNDSRVAYPDNIFGCKTVTVHNNGSIDDLFNQTIMALQSNDIYL